MSRSSLELFALDVAASGVDEAAARAQARTASFREVAPAPATDARGVVDVRRVDLHLNPDGTCVMCDPKLGSPDNPTRAELRAQLRELAAVLRAAREHASIAFALYADACLCALMDAPDLAELAAAARATVEAVALVQAQCAIGLRALEERPGPDMRVRVEPDFLDYRSCISWELNSLRDRTRTLERQVRVFLLRAGAAPPTKETR